jgi:hypothetical protein
MFDTNFWRFEIVRKGSEREPVVIIDNFAAEPTALIDQAASLRFTAMSPYFPGIRAPVAQQTSQAMQEALAPLMRQVFGVESCDVEGCFFSLVTTRPEQLAPIQRLPHYDGVEPGRMALVHYLCGSQHGGTSFYRHRATGFETVRADRFAIYRDALAADVRRVGLPASAYISGDTPVFERVTSVPCVFNRAILYRGRNLHSGDIPRGFQFDPGPRSGRLTITAFWTSR